MQKFKKGFTLEITTTALCNLGCTYCFEGVKTDKRRLDDKVELVKKRAHELLKSNWFNENYDYLTMSFWGGEPTLNGQLMVDIIQEFQKFDNVEFHLYTNGYNRKRLDDILDKIDTSKIEIQISYDGKDINDKFRITHSGKPTSQQVVENIEYFARKGITIHLKSTIPTKSMKGLHRVWLDFRNLHEHLNSIGDNIQVNYAPTIDYVNEIAMDDLPQLISDFRSEMIKIAKDEIAFYKQNGYYLCTWFGKDDSRIHCSSGHHMHAIDVDGQTYACHGSLYSPNKDLMKGSSIELDSFVDDVMRMSQAYAPPARASDICTNCVATTCMICPVSSLDNSKKEDYFERWTDRWVNNMCGFFKAFGEIDRSVQHYVERNP